MEEKMKIAIDGPAGAGKSTIAKRAAEKLGFLYVDTGAMYRAVGLYMIENGIDILDEKAVAAVIDKVNIDIRFENKEQVILLNGENVNPKIRMPEVSNAASKTSAYPKVRERLFDLQKKIAEENSVIMDGRDIGTVILPDAELKIFLTASPEVRGNRRYKELVSKGISADLSSIIEDIKIRDHQDETREVSPLKQADDAILLDSSELTIDEVVAAIIKLAVKNRNS
jgi:cytidylate kinase